MRDTLVCILLTSFVVFALSVVVPSAAYWNTNGVVLWRLAPFWVAAWILKVWAIWRDDETDDSDEPANGEARTKDNTIRVQIPCWYVRRGNARQIAMCCNWFLALLALAFAWLPAWWSWQASTVSGTSSGSTVQDDPTVAYSAAGHFGPYAPFLGPVFPLVAWTFTYASFQDTVCVFDSSVARWGDDSPVGTTVIGYPPDPNQPGYPDLTAQPCAPGVPCLATNRSQDYPNPSWCLSGGAFFGENNTLNTNLIRCPGSAVVGQDGTWVGLSTCAYCLPYARAHQGWVDPNTARCPQFPPSDAKYGPGGPRAQDDWFMCTWMCPGLGSTLTPQSMQSAFSSFVVTALWLILEYMISVCAELRIATPPSKRRLRVYDLVLDPERKREP